jgi:hypothetical protein
MLDVQVSNVLDMTWQLANLSSTAAGKISDRIFSSGTRSRRSTKPILARLKKVPKRSDAND